MRFNEILWMVAHVRPHHDSKECRVFHGFMVGQACWRLSSTPAETGTDFVKLVGPNRWHTKAAQLKLLQ